MPSVPTSTTIRRLRELAGLSIDELAARGGLPVAAVQRAERGGGPITAFTPIAVALGVDPKPLLKDHPAQASRIEAEVGCNRIRPEEVAAASGLPHRPADYAAAEPAGRDVLAQAPALRRG